MRGALSLATVALLTLAYSVACTSELPPLGEVRFSVDTDVPVPGIANRLRLDVYRADGVWIDSRETALDTPAAWPATFSLFLPREGGPATNVLVRLRAFADGRTRDYQGERFSERPPASSSPAQPPPAPATHLPRLVVDGRDLTPTSEPRPGATIDRLLDVKIEPGSVRYLDVRLAGACAGTMADLYGRRTCIDRENQRIGVTPTSLQDHGLAEPSRVGSFGASPSCNDAPRAASAVDGVPLFDDEICVPGGAFVFGLESSVPGAGVPAAPERVAVIPALLVDKYEVTVGRWREATRRGFRPSDPRQLVAHDDKFGTDLGDANRNTSQDSLCTYTPTPRWETHALSCVAHDAAAAFCQASGGDLLTEAQWEWVALAAGRPKKTAYPWGDGAVTGCAQAVFGRWRSGTIKGECFANGSGDLQGFGPLPVDARATGDVTPLGIVGLGGGLQEHVRGTAYSLGSLCWLSQPQSNPNCEDAASPAMSSRGGAFNQSSAALAGSARETFNRDTYSRYQGFRCARHGRSP